MQFWEDPLYSTPIKHLSGDGVATGDSSDWDKESNTINLYQHDQESVKPWLNSLIPELISEISKDLSIMILVIYNGTLNFTRIEIYLGFHILESWNSNSDSSED